MTERSLVFRFLILGWFVAFAVVPAHADDRPQPTVAEDGAAINDSATTLDLPTSVTVAYPAAPTPRPMAQRAADTAIASMRSGPRIKHAPAIIAAARANGVDPWLLSAVIQVESASRAQALSPKGARGLMQLMPDTARGVGIADAQSLFDPAVNVEAGARQLRALHVRFGSLRLVLAAYNAGDAAVRRYGGVPPFAETTAYVARVLARYRAMGGHA